MSIILDREFVQCHPGNIFAKRAFFYCDLRMVSSEVERFLSFLPSRTAKTYGGFPETILGAFGFKRENLGFEVKAKRFIEELKRERNTEILAELENLR